MYDPGPVDAPAEKDVPLVVDIDGTLMRSDLLVESGLGWIAANPRRVVEIPALLRQGKAPFKARIAAETPLDVTSLPYNEAVLSLIEQARRDGRQVYLASASNRKYVAAIACHVGADGWFSSDDTVNLKAEAKARKLVEAFGPRGFDYVGNDRADLPVWAASRRRIAIGPSQSTSHRLAAIDADATILDRADGGLRAWIRLLRPHQWTKNVLVFVPMLTSHQLDLASALASLIAFLAFSFAASAIYIVNDLVDAEADRAHPSKRHRPLAAGTIPAIAAPPVAAILAMAALAISLAVSWPLTAILVCYLILTTAYSVSLKRKMLIDVVALATLYTLRVLAGAAAIAVPVSEWLLGFCMFIFTSLALIKRYVELATLLDAGLPDPANRNYQKSDLGIIAALAAASGFNAVTVFALYVSSQDVRLLYPYPQLLWLACPILMYWIGRMIIMAGRRYLDDDPVLFALRDRNSLVAFALTGLILAAASVSW